MSETKATIAKTEVSLPKGGGAIQGIGETFQANEFTGTAALSIPIPTSPCRDFAPQLSLEYSSGSGNGTFGLGWGLTIPNISRKTSKAIPKYDETDTFLISNAEDLVPQREEPKTVDNYKVISYRPRVEGLFAKIERWINPKGDFYWRTVSRDNVTSIFGKNPEARICDPENKSHVFQWLLEETYDSKGNSVVYCYKSENLENVSQTGYEVNRSQMANKYIERIQYGNSPLSADKALKNVCHFEVVFDYGEYNIAPSNLTPYNSVQKWENRRDPFSSYHAGFEIRTHRLCRNILMFHRFKELGKDPILVHATQFKYEEPPNNPEEIPTVSLLKSVQSTGYRYEGGKYKTKSLPPVEFDYTAFTPDQSHFQPLLQENDRGLPGLNLPPNYLSIDLYGEGIPGVLYSDGTTTQYWEAKGDESTSNQTHPQPNPPPTPLRRGARVEQEGSGKGTVKYGSPKLLQNFPIDRLVQDENRTLTDLAGDGRMALVVSTTGYSGYYQYDPNGETWQSWQPFEGFPTDYRNPNNHMVDVTGDGLADILLVESDRLRIYRNQGEKGYGNPLICPRENDVPMNKNGDVEEVLRFADIFGTGKQHLVRITNGRVECWPNLGYGKFGKKIELAKAPIFGDRLDESRLFLVDIDGSGTADIAYVYGDRLKIWFNYSGNSFSEPLLIPLLLPSEEGLGVGLAGGGLAWDNLNQINFADVLGNGTTGLVFSENHPQPRHWYYDLCNKQKPYLLNQVKNNLGAETKITYASSTKFYLQDKQQGTPWVTKLPFPVQVVEKVENFDRISNTKLVSCYSYHHGYYDRAEKEFRGFGRVERQDAETLSTPNLTHPQPLPGGESEGNKIGGEQEGKEYYVPPILTKTWYHTGAWLQQKSLFEQYQKEYFAEDKQAITLPEPTFAWGDDEPSPEEVRQAHASLKGAVLHKEVYGLDGSEVAVNPYSVSETGYQVKLLQPQGKNEYGVFYVWSAESLAYDYERNPEDPRISHQFTVEIDEYGHVLQDCAVAYGRRELTEDVLPVQTSLKVTCSKNRLVNLTESDVRLLGVPVESKSYEIIKPTLPQGKDYFNWEDISKWLNDLQLNLLSWERHLYWNESLDKILPLGKVSPEGLLARSEVAVVSTDKIKSAFDGVLSEKELEDSLKKEGKYVKDGDYWWNPGLTQHYLQKEDFYLPGKTSDPFGYETLVEYDSYLMFATKVTDAIGNTTTIEAIDYQTLQPTKIRDINDNISEVKMDALGMVILTSHYGTEEGKNVGFAPLTDASLPQFDMETALNNPQTYLQGAASYFYYDLDAWKEHEIPVHIVNLIAVNYPTNSPPAPVQGGVRGGLDQGWVSQVQTNISYSDGFGREVQTKMRVEPGEAFKRDGSKEEMCDSRWLSSGGKVYNNKGNPVREYEPYFINTYEYVDNPALNQFGVSSVLHYDPLERVICVDTPKGFFTKVEFTPWEEKHYDENDTVKDARYYKDNINNPDLPSAERKALEKAAKFYNTPEIKILDNLGRTVRDVQLLEDQTELVTYYEFDIVGNELSSADPRLSKKYIKNFQTVYDLTKTALKTVSVDAGTHWTLQNVMGNPIYVKDSRNFVVKTKYDELHRPIEVRVQGGDGKVPLDNITERIIYGELCQNDNNANTSNLAKDRNLRGQIYQHYDSAGLVELEGYSLDGQPMRTKQRLREDYKEEANWEKGKEEEYLQKKEPYITNTGYDALGRVIESTDADQNVHRPIYHLSGHLKEMVVTHDKEEKETDYVRDIEYNPKGQRCNIVYGNGVTTEYEYEATTFHLTRILTRRKEGSQNKILQDLNYTYDPVGNITQIEDKAWKTVFNNNQKVDPVSQYTYDALYRLVSATGRQHPGLSGKQERHGDIPEELVVPLQSTNNGQAVENYIQSYSYDDGGNLYRIQHHGKTPRTRTLTVAEGSNRAVDSTLLEGRTVEEFFDANGNQIEMKGKMKLEWNFHDNIANVVLVERDGGKNDGEYYVYDSSGSRVRKVTERYGNGGEQLHIEEAIYLGGVEIRQTRQQEKVRSERHSLRVMDDETCVAERNKWTVGEPPEEVMNPQVRYQLENHLGSATMEVDSSGQLISYEEYFPYGGTAFVAGRNVAEVKLKKYRYSGKERDASTGLYYYGARYYAPWLGRWMSCDPAGRVDGLNLYAFVGGNPVNHRDIKGKMKLSTNQERLYKYHANMVERLFREQARHRPSKDAYRIYSLENPGSETMTSTDASALRTSIYNESDDDKVKVKRQGGDEVLTKKRMKLPFIQELDEKTFAFHFRQREPGELKTGMKNKWRIALTVNPAHAHHLPGILRKLVSNEGIPQVRAAKVMGMKFLGGRTDSAIIYIWSKNRPSRMFKTALTGIIERQLLSDMRLDHNPLGMEKLGKGISFSEYPTEGASHGKEHEKLFGAILDKGGDRILAYIAGMHLTSSRRSAAEAGVSVKAHTAQAQHTAMVNTASLSLYVHEEHRVNPIPGRYMLDTVE